MLTLAGYENLIQIHESDNSLVYRARKVENNQPVILKFLNRDYPTTEQIRRYKQEYHLTCQLDSPRIAKAHSLEEWQRSFVIVLEDFGGISLKEWFKQREKLTIEEFLCLAIAAVESIGEIHAINIIHKDINPANLVFNPETKELKIIDFGISTQLSRENPTLKNPNVLEGSLAYISPEQTGRMNRSLDYRTDFYSLGVTFYELLTGQLPFTAEEPLELVHCHIAKKPRSPSEIDPSIPSVVSKIILKLMAKNAEDRYQSTSGIESDLVVCLMQLEASLPIEDIAIGENDISSQFQIPQKLYGREEEIATLLAAYDRVAAAGKVELMMVAGYSGIGKSSLVRELYKPITARRGYFISGKFDQFQRNIPYSAIVVAFRGLIGQLLGENKTQLQGWRDKLLKALDSNGQVIIDVIPEVELIIGKQPIVPVLGANESQNRFNLVISNFIRVFCHKDHPLTLFIDDLQWADLATLKLIERMLIEGQSKYFLLLGAYRDNEVSASHPLIMTLKKLQENKATINQIDLKPLPSDRIPDLIGDTLQQPPQTARELGKLVWEKTGGNPFFLKEFLQALHDENLLQFHRQSRSWQWDIAEIKARNFTDNVVELMVLKLQQLPTSSQEILSIAACLGAEFELTILTWIVEKSPSDIFASLKIALDIGLIFPRSELDENLLIQSYKFNHDRIQQAAYSLISDSEKQEFSLQIGRLLLANLPPQERMERIFEIVDRLNGGRVLITDELESLELVKLNLSAGKKAKDATAYVAAREYLKVGMEELQKVTEDPWLTQYELTFTLSKELGLLEYFNGNLNASEELMNYALTRVTSALDKAEIYNLLIIQYTMMAKYSDAIETGRKGLALFGSELPKTDLKNALLREVELVKQNLGDREIASLLNEPEIQIPEQKMVEEILVNIDLPTYFFDQELYSVVVVKMVNLSLTYGHIAESAKGYAAYGILLSSVLRDYQLGYEFGRLAINLSDRFNSQSQKCSSCIVVAGHINHWVKHIKYAKELFDDSYHFGLLSGELRYAGYALEHGSRYLFYQGLNLQQILELIPKYLQFLQQTNNQWAVDGMLGFQLALLNLLELTSSELDFHNDTINEVEYLESCRGHNSFAWLCTFNVFKSQTLYLYDYLEIALEAALEAGKYLHFVLSQFQSSEHNFHYSLILAALYLEATEENKQQYWQQLEANQKQMKIWMDSCPENFEHKYLLIAAEMARISGRDLEAMELYDRAIESARKQEFIQNEALANELAAKFWLAKGKVEFAKIYLKNARYGYEIWGAKRKVKHLEAKYPQLYQSPIASTNPSPATVQQAYYTNESTFQSTTSSSNSNLDITTLMKASQSIASEIVLSQLLTQLIAILLENTGAESGFLILETEGELLVQAEAGANGEITVLESMPIQFVKPDGSQPLLCSAIVNYVFRSGESVVLSDACNEGNFTDRDYIQNYQVKSVLCVPLVNQGQLAGVVYLENNLTVGAFTRERVEIVRLLSGQAAIAITNAKLYTEIKQSEQRLKQFLEAIPIGVAVHHPTGQLHYANQTAQQLLGINMAPDAKTEEIAEAYRVYRAGTQKLYPNERLPIVRSLAGETVKAEDLEIHQPDKIVPLEVSSTPIFDETGKLTYGIAAFQDITERKQADKLMIDYNQSLETQLALAWENTQLYEASKRFVPQQFLSFLEKKSIVDVELGDRVEREMTVLFSDIRDFTSISEKMTPEENFAFINEYLGYMEPQIQKYGGFIDKYIGDAIMALFPNSADDALKGAIAMLEELKTYNGLRQQKNLNPIRIGIGLHAGTLMLGTVGGMGRMDGTVIGDAVNLSSRVEGLTKTYGVSLLITHQTLARLNNPLEYDLRFMEQVKAKGKAKAVGLFEVFSADLPELREAKIATKEKFEMAVMLYHWGSFSEAARLFEECVEVAGGDRAARTYKERCGDRIS